MKRPIRFIFLLMAILLILCACGSQAADSAASDESAVTDGANAAAVDLDLTQLSSTMVYSEVYNIMTDPEDYVGQTIRMEGQCLSAYYEPTKTTYYSIVIQDATACCAQGIEYVLSDGQSYPADGGNATVTGRFESYDEEGTVWYHLVDANIEV